MSKESKIYKNIYIENIDVSGLTKNDTIKKLNDSLYKDECIKLNYKNKEYDLKLNDINFKFKVEDAADKAISIGRDSDIFTNAKTKLNLRLGKNIKLNVDTHYDENKLKEYIKSLSEEINISPVDSSITIENDKFNVSKEKYGISINQEKLFDKINEKIMNKDFGNTDIPTEPINPKYTYEKLSNINVVLGEYETKFKLKNQNRVSNIKLAINKINNVLVDSNEEFSFNSIIGRRSVEQGFKHAPIIVNGEPQLGMGGGICQVSSTVYNAALYSGLEIVQAKNHSIPSGYIEKGRDATVSYGSIDLVFKNNYKYPILIKSEVKGDKIITTIYGNESDRKIVDIKTEIIQIIKSNIIEKESKDLYEGKTQVESKGRDGYKVKTYRVYKNYDGSVVNEELVNESYYPPKNKVIIKGTKKKVDTTKKLNTKTI
ncbi:VanW family protein [Paraclostridium ghonii]|uniref:VanW family protein n=1 Tax=Paraclostridium ghonii TaxID=29358 RepID=UPI00306D0A2A|nr:VanW family protein [Paeniclostridium ghonii]